MIKQRFLASSLSILFNSLAEIIHAAKHVKLSPH